MKEGDNKKGGRIHEERKGFQKLLSKVTELRSFVSVLCLMQTMLFPFCRRSL